MSTNPVVLEQVALASQPPETNGKPPEQSANLAADANWNMSSEQEQSRALYLADLYQRNMFQQFVLPAAAAAAASATAIALEKLSSINNNNTGQARAPITPGNKMQLAGVKKRRRRRRRKRPAQHQAQLVQGTDQESVGSSIQQLNIQPE